MKHKVYAFIGKQPYGLVDVFTSRQKAKMCAKSVNKHVLKDNSGKIVSLNTKIVISHA